MRARAEWQFGTGPEYCAGCSATGSECGARCPQVEHAPESVEAGAMWNAAMTALRGGFAGVELDVAGCVALASRAGVADWLLGEWLPMIAQGMSAGLAARRDASRPVEGGK